MKETNTLRKGKFEKVDDSKELEKIYCQLTTIKKRTRLYGIGPGLCREGERKVGDVYKFGEEYIIFSEVFKNFAGSDKKVHEYTNQQRAVASTKLL